LASSNFQAFRELFPSVALRLSLTVGDEPRRRHNAVSATAEKLKGIQRDIQESINAIKHIGNRDLQHVIHGL